MTLSPAMHRRANPRPLSFTLVNQDDENVLFTLGGVQTMTLQITNLSHANLSISSSTEQEEPPFALCFGAGVLAQPEAIAITPAKVDQTPEWAIVDRGIEEAGGKYYLWLRNSAALQIPAGRSIRMALTGLRAQGGQGSHGTLVALRYRSLFPADSRTALHGMAAQHLAVLQASPPQLWREDDPSRPVDAKTLNSKLDELRDHTLAPIRVEGGPLFGSPVQPRLTLRASPDLSRVGAGRARLSLKKGASIRVSSDDAQLKVTSLLASSLPSASGSDWTALPSAQLALDELGAAAPVALALGATGAGIELSLGLSVSGPPRMSQLRIDCDGLELDGRAMAPLILRTPIMLRAFGEQGWNFMLPPEAGGAFRIGASDARSSAEMTVLQAQPGSLSIGPSGGKANTSLVLASDEEHSTQVAMVRQRADGSSAQRAEINLNKNGFQFAHRDKTAMTVDNEGRVGIGNWPSAGSARGPEFKPAALNVDGRVKDQTGWLLPVGSIIAFAGVVPPDGWLLCNGQVLKTTDPLYKDLYAVISASFGREVRRNFTYGPNYPNHFTDVIDTETFRVPDLQQKFIAGATADGDYQAGKTGGQDRVQLGFYEMPSHSHPASTSLDGAHSHTGQCVSVADNDDNDGWGNYIGNRGNYNKDYTGVGVISSTGSSHRHSVNVTNAGGNQSHENRPPFVALNYIIKY